ncbi:hypothetical protein [Enterococcus sp. LJL51]|uniref:hypothetical protein n=1 Tax=Enterococcus sp. LJL51 TaxID=3416656 RepID=UPI003CF051FF
MSIAFLKQDKDGKLCFQSDFSILDENFLELVYQNRYLFDDKIQELFDLDPYGDTVLSVSKQKTLLSVFQEIKKKQSLLNYKDDDDPGLDKTIQFLNDTIKNSNIVVANGD